MARKEVPEDEGPSQEWLASYADAMTLLLAFFIMMFAFALIDEEKFEDFKVGVAATLGLPDPATENTDSILNAGQGITPEIGYTPIETESDVAAEALQEALAAAGEITPENAEELKELLQSEFARVGAAEVVDVGIDERGVFIRFDGRVLFESGSAQLDQEGLTLLAVAADVLDVIDNRLEVEGHTDDRPTNGANYPTNWELSSARASRVVRWMIEVGSIPAPQMMAVGLADTRPTDDNSTPEGRQANRRVEIVVRVDGIVDSDVPVIDPLEGAIDGAFELDDSDVDNVDTGDDETVDPESGDPVSGDPQPADPAIDPGLDDAVAEQPTTEESEPADPATEPVDLDEVEESQADG
ncbi:MAG: OmpA family protein [Actinomycetota bacterium]